MTNFSYSLIFDYIFTYIVFLWIIYPYLILTLYSNSSILKNDKWNYMEMDIINCLDFLKNLLVEMLGFVGISLQLDINDKSTSLQNITRRNNAELKHIRIKIYTWCIFFLFSIISTKVVVYSSLQLVIGGILIDMI